MSQPQESGDGVAVAISSEVMIGAVVFLFMVVVFVFLLYLYARRYLGAAPAFGSSTARFIFVQENGAARRRGLDPAVLQALPITYYSAADFREPLECAVCLSELADGEKARILPRCSHGFHLECIDMWFHSNSTCPLCRCPVGPEPAENLASGAAGSPEIVNPEAVPRESPILPTNVLFWGNLDQINTGSSAMAANGMQKGRSSSSGMSSSKPEGMLVIEIPRRAVEGFPSPISPLPSSRMAGEEMKTPPSARLRSLRRLLSRGKRAVGTSCSPRGGGDIEQGLVACGGLAGEGSAPTPRTPTGLSVV